MDFSPIKTPLKSPVSPVISQLMRKDREINSLRDELSALKLENTDHTRQITYLQRELEKRDTYIEELLDQQETLTNQIKELEQMLDELEEQLKSDKSKIQELENQTIKQKQQLQDRNLEIENIRQEYSSRKEDIIVENQILKNQVKSQEQIMKDMEMKYKSEKREKTTDNPDFKEQMSDLIRIVKRLENQLNEQQSLLQEKNSEIENLKNYSSNDYYKQKSQQHYKKRIMEFETILEYIREVSKGYSSLRDEYLSRFSEPNPDIEQILTNAYKVFDRNQKLKKFVQLIECDISKLYMILEKF